MEKKRVFLIVLDSYGIGEMTDAADFGDVGANTLKTITKVKEYDTPNMKGSGFSTSMAWTGWRKKSTLSVHMHV